VSELRPLALEEFCAESGLSARTLACALRDLPRTGDGVVVRCGSTYHHRGIEPLLDTAVAYLPSPPEVPPVRGTQAGAAQERATEPAGPWRLWRSR